MYKYLILIFSVILVVSCTTSTSTKNSSLSGMIVLLDSDDHSGVTVALYNLAYLDTTLVRINQQYPHIGVIITQETEFDHRLQTPVKFTQTDLAGNFKLEGIRPGKYNIALLKEGYSLRYVYNLHLSEGSNILTTNNSFSNSDFESLESFAVNNNSKIKIQNSKLNNSSVITLYPSVDVPSVVSTPISFESGVQYNFPQNTIITAPVTIEPGTILAVGVNRKIDFHSTISTPETGIRWWLTSSHSINSLSEQINNTKNLSVSSSSSWLNDFFFDRINILGTSQITLQNGKVSFLKDGINISPNNSIYKNIRAQHGFSHANVGSDNHIFSNNLISDFSQRVHMFSGSSVIEKNIFYNNIENMLLSENEVLVQNNYFQSNYVALRPFYGNINIKNNNFENNDFSISTVASEPLIEYNTFYGSKTYCIQTHRYYVQASHDYSNPIISNNNLYGNNISLALIARANMFSGYSYLAEGGRGVRTNIDAKNNYWKHSPVIDYIIDNTTYPNEPTNSPNFCPYLIIYEPKRNTKVPNAGIQ